MRGFFEPRSVVVVGVSERPDNLARNIVHNLHEFGFGGLVQCVGVRPGVVFGHRIHPSVASLPDPADLAVVLAPARFLPAIVEDCARGGVRRVIIESSGFTELGGEGTGLARQVLETAHRHGIRILGPNGIGVMSLHDNLAVPFSRLEDRLIRGRVALVCQSGGVGISYLTSLMAERIGVSRFASIGNKLDVDENDLLEFLLTDEDTDAIVLYLEGIAEGARLLDLARGARKPILLHKANTGRIARSIAASHTASLAGDDAVVDAACRQAGILRFSDADELGYLLKVLALPPARGRRLAVLSRSGGHAVIASDACEAHGFELAPFPADFEARVAARARAGVIRPTNPLDLGDVFDFSLYVELARDLLQLDEVDGLVFLHTYVPEEEGASSRRTLQGMAEAGREAGKPVLLGVATHPVEREYLRNTLPWPVFGEIQVALAALDRVLGCREGVEATRPTVPSCAADPFPAGQAPTLPEVLARLQRAGVPVPPARFARSVDEARAAEEAVGGPVALKVVSPALSHKTDVGGVRLGLTGDAVVEAAADLLALAGNAPGHGVLVQPMAPDGVDLLVGARRDPVFGPVLALGLGGIWVEVLRDVALRVMPVSGAEVEGLLRGLGSWGLLAGVRGHPGVDLAAVVQAVLSFQAFFLANPDLSEAEVNPLRATPAGAVALDARAAR